MVPCNYLFPVAIYVPSCTLCLCGYSRVRRASLCPLHIGQSVRRTPGDIFKVRFLNGVSSEVLLRVNEQRNILHEIWKRKANLIGHILSRNCLLQQVIEGKIKGQIEVKRRRGRRRKKLLDDLKDRGGYCQLKEEALDRTMWRNRFGRGFGPVVWQITDDGDDVFPQLRGPTVKGLDIGLHPLPSPAEV